MQRQLLRHMISVASCSPLQRSIQGKIRVAQVEESDPMKEPIKKIMDAIKPSRCQTCYRGGKAGHSRRNQQQDENLN